VANLLAVSGATTTCGVTRCRARAVSFSVTRWWGREAGGPAPEAAPGGGLRAFHEVRETVTPYPGQPAATPHAVVQLSSGSTGPSKVIGRTAANLVAEVERYTRIDGVPRPGERIVVLASMVHVLGLVGGLLYGLHAR